MQWKRGRSTRIQSISGTDAYSGSRIIRHFSPDLGSIVLRFSLESGLRNSTSEVRVDIPAGRVDSSYTDRILSELKSYSSNERTEEERSRGTLTCRGGKSYRPASH